VIVLALMARPKGGEGVKSGPIGLAVILVLCIAVYFLFKSMSKHLKKVRDEFPADPAATTASTATAPQHEPTAEIAGDQPGVVADEPVTPAEPPPRSDAAP
jgi:hypothetical protein